MFSPFHLNSKDIMIMVPGAECSACINRSDFFTSLTVLKIDGFHLKGAVKSDK